MKRYVWCAGFVLLAAGVSQAQDKTNPPEAPAAVEAPAATVSGTPLVGPAVPVPSYYPATPCAARRHPLLLWLTYVPSRRPYFDGHICQKAPNIQAPLYDYFPCVGEACYTCGTTKAWHACNGRFCNDGNCAGKCGP